MELKLAPKVFDALVAQLREHVNQIRGLERQVMALCVRDAGMPRKDFIASFPKNETNLHWIDKHIRSKRKHSSALAQASRKRCKRQKRLQKIEESIALDRRHQGDQSRDLARRGARRAARRRRWSRRTCVS